MSRFDIVADKLSDSTDSVLVVEGRASFSSDDLRSSLPLSLARRVALCWAPPWSQRIARSSTRPKSHSQRLVTTRMSYESMRVEADYY